MVHSIGKAELSDARNDAMW